MQIQSNISLKKFNTFGIDVSAKYFSDITNVNQIEELYASHIGQEKSLILGGGSNVLFTKNFDGIIIKISIPGIKKIKEEEEQVLIQIGAGVIWQDLVDYCITKNYWGIENLSLIPGTVGAAPIQNIGAYGQELKNVFHSLSGFNIDEKIEYIYSKGDCGFGYRNSVFKNELKNKILITSVTLKLSKKPNLILSYKQVSEEIEKRKITTPSIVQISEIISDIRRSKLPNPKQIGNAGSFFKNPEISEEKFNQFKNEFADIKGFQTNKRKIKISAAWLIEKGGWKGKRNGDVASFEKQALVLVNYGNATGADVLEFSKSIKETILDKFGIELIEEINII